MASTKTLYPAYVSVSCRIWFCVCHQCLSLSLSLSLFLSLLQYSHYRPVFFLCSEYRTRTVLGAPWKLAGGYEYSGCYEYSRHRRNTAHTSCSLLALLARYAPLKMGNVFRRYAASAHLEDEERTAATPGDEAVAFSPILTAGAPLSAPRSLLPLPLWLLLGSGSSD